MLRVLRRLRVFVFQTFCADMQPRTQLQLPIQPRQRRIHLGAYRRLLRVLGVQRRIRLVRAVHVHGVATAWRWMRMVFGTRSREATQSPRSAKPAKERRPNAYVRVAATSTVANHYLTPGTARATALRASRLCRLRVFVFQTFCADVQPRTQLQLPIQPRQRRIHLGAYRRLLRVLGVQRRIGSYVRLTRTARATARRWMRMVFGTRSREATRSPRSAKPAKGRRPNAYVRVRGNFYRGKPFLTPGTARATALRASRSSPPSCFRVPNVLRRYAAPHPTTASDSTPSTSDTPRRTAPPSPRTAHATSDSARTSG